MLASTFVYAYPFAGPQSFSYGNGQTYYQSRDQDYRPSISSDGPRTKQATYDAAGNLKTLNNVSNGALSYAYDASGRLLSALDTASGSFGSLAWTYDKNGNRQSETRNAGTMPYAYSPTGSNWLYQRGSDSRGKTANGHTASFTYDGFNRLATSQTASETTTYTYNALGQRIKKRNQNGLQTVFHYGQNGELLYERDQAGNTKEYVWLDGRPLARIDNGNAIYYYHVDHLGTPQAMTNSAGATVWKADYEPFGKATVKVSTIENNLRLPGQYYDRETGLHYNYFRDYEPGTGRYIESDPIGLEGGLNVYGYANQNPVMFDDPLGLTGEVAIWGPRFGAAGAMSVADGPLPIGEGIAAIYLVGSVIYDVCKDDPCKEILAQIQDVMRQLNRRYMHQCRNKKNQWEAHVPEFEKTKRQLAKLVTQAEAMSCLVPPQAYVWLQTQCPTPGTPRNSSPGY